MKVDIYSGKGEKKGKRDLCGIFTSKINEGLLHQFIVMQGSNSRVAIAHTKNRGEVRGGGRKPWRQKKLGRARFCSTRVNIWRGGAVVHGPRNNRVFEKDMPKKMRRAALATACSLMAKDKKIFEISDFPSDEPKTKVFKELVSKTPASKAKRVLLVIPSGSEVVSKSARNLREIKILRAEYLNPRDVLWGDEIVLFGEAHDVIEKTFCSKDKKVEKPEDDK